MLLRALIYLLNTTFIQGLNNELIMLLRALKYLLNTTFIQGLNNELIVMLRVLKYFYRYNKYKSEYR